MADEFPFRNADMPDNHASNGGEVPVKDVRNYQPPQGPIGIGHSGPGLGGTNHGPSGGQQGRH